MSGRDEHTILQDGKITVTKAEVADYTKKKGADYTTITIPRIEYEKLVNFKEKLGMRPDYSWVAGLGLGAFIGFMIGLAAIAAKRSIITCGRCGTQIDVTELSHDSFKCPNCGQEFVRLSQPKT
jgi:predicted RNA-binding Zn-ribbon protein involved in translation (DUF1610 family)